MSKIIDLFFEKAREKSPQSLRALGNLLRAALKNARDLEISSMAASLAYTTVLSIVPLLTVAYAIFTKLGGLKYAFDKAQPFLIETLSEGAGESARRTLEHFIENAHGKGVGWVGFAALLLTAITTYTEINGAFRKIWSVKKMAPFIKRAEKVLILLVAAPLLLALSLALTTAAATRIASIPWSSGLSALLVSYILFSLLYALTPSAKVPLPILLRGAILPAALWELTKAGFTTYTTRVVKYASIYGSLAAVPLFLLWIYLAWYIALFGAIWIHILQDTAMKKSE